MREKSKVKKMLNIPLAMNWILRKECKNMAGLCLRD